MSYFAAGAALVGTLSASSGPAGSSTAPQDNKPFFFTGNFSGATGSASASGAPGLLLPAVVGLLVYVATKK